MGTAAVPEVVSLLEQTNTSPGNTKIADITAIKMHDAIAVIIARAM